MATSLEAIVAATVAVLSELVAPDRVDERQHGASTWANAPGRDQTYWIVGSLGSEGRPAGVGGAHSGNARVMRETRIGIDVWMPWASDRNTSEAFREKLSAALYRLTERKRLGICARMRELPGIALNRIGPYSSLNAGDTGIVCHHGRIEFTVFHHETVATS